MTVWIAAAIVLGVVALVLGLARASSRNMPSPPRPVTVHDADLDDPAGVAGHTDEQLRMIARDPSPHRADRAAYARRELARRHLKRNRP